ncbi:unnamed protein product [Linum trigynum]|uniref:Uncharacterized protein n=1 Tax=Linum trigynum TaxID=586398 RepID=A0AAV2E5J6_9ROSI
MWIVSKDAPRRAIHAVKVGLALTLVSMLYLLEPLFEGISQNAIWPVMTVVVVLEFTVGVTLCKGLNRGLGTILAGSLAYLIEFIAEATGHVGCAISSVCAVFIIGMELFPSQSSVSLVSFGSCDFKWATTYLRFLSYVKKNYDYRVVIFLLTFNLITVSNFRVSNVMKIEHDGGGWVSYDMRVCRKEISFIFIF